MPSTKWYLYQIDNVVNGKRYVGITTNPKRRRSQHLCSRKNTTTVIQNAIRKHGQAAFEFSLLCCGHESDIKALEIALITSRQCKVPNGYNVASGGEARSGVPCSPSTRMKISAANKGRKMSEETRRRMSQAKAGVLHSSEHRQRIGDAHRGGRSYNAHAIEIGGHTYSCLKEAADALGVKYCTLKAQVSKYKTSGEWPDGWSLVNKVAASPEE